MKPQNASCSCLTCQRRPRGSFRADKDRRRVRREAQAASDYGDKVLRAYVMMRMTEEAQREAFVSAHLAIAKEIQRRMVSEAVGGAQ